MNLIEIARLVIPFAIGGYLIFKTVTLTNDTAELKRKYNAVSSKQENNLKRTIKLENKEDKHLLDEIAVDVANLHPLTKEVDKLQGQIRVLQNKSGNDVDLTDIKNKIRKIEDIISEEEKLEKYRELAKLKKQIKEME